MTNQNITRSIFVSLSLVAFCQGQNLEQFAQAHLPAGMELAHPAVSGSFGPAGRHTVMLYRPTGDDGEFKGVVYVEGKRAYELPALGLIPNQFAVEVKSVFFENAAGGSRPELFIL